MSLDLKLLPFDTHETDVLQFSHTVLSCVTHRELSDAIQQIEEAKGVEVSAGFNSYVSRDDKYEDTHYGETLETPYGKRLKYVEVEYLNDLAGNENLIGGHKNKAIWAYLAGLKPRTKVALFWH